MQQADEGLEQYALSRSRTADDGERLPGPDRQGQPVEDNLRAEGLVQVLNADDVGPIAQDSTRSKIFVRKKSATRTDTEATATVSVVARPTPSVPPVTRNPW